MNGAGEIRWVNIAKGNMFGNYEFIEQIADQLPLHLAYYPSEINVLHPFREENGRA